MTKVLIAYATTLIVFLGLDFVFLSAFGAKTYKSTLGDVMNSNVNFPPAVLFYLIFVAGILYFAVLPAVQEGRWTLALQNGALLGFISYLTYDFTNLAVIRNWTWALAITDIVWGTVLTTVAAGVGAGLTTKLTS